MASTDAKPIPQKNVAYRVTFPIFDADGDLVTGAAGLDSEVSKDGGTFTDCTNEATEIATSSGMYYLDLTSTEMNADTVAVIVKTSTSGAKTTPLVFYPQEADDIRVSVTFWSTSAIATPDTAGYPKVTIKDGTGTGEIDTTSGGVLVAAYASGAAPLQPTVAGRTLDVSTGGEAGVDWANVGSPTTSNGLTNTTISTSQQVASVSGAVGSVTAGVTVTTNNDKTGYGLSAAAVQAIWDALTSALTTVGSIGKRLADDIDATISSRLASASYTTPPTVGQIADQVWDETLSDHLGAGSTGAALNAAGSAGDPWSTALPGAYGAGTAGKIVGDNIDATISSRATAAALATVQADTDDIQTRLPAALVSGRMDASVGAYQSGLTPLQPTVAGRTLDVSTGGEAGLDWANIGSPTTAQNLSATNIDTDQVVASVTNPVTVGTNTDKTGYTLSAAGVQAIWDALTSALTTVGSIGKRLADNIDATISSRLASASYTTPPTATQNADELLKRDWTSVTGEASRSVLNALRFLRNKWSVTATTLTVTKEDDTATAWTAALTTDATADPIIGSDPT